MLPMDMSRKVAFRARHGALIGYLVHRVIFLSVRPGQCSRTLGAKSFFAKMVDAQIRHNAVNPCVKRALETEPRQLQIGAKERFLIDILTVFGRTAKMNRDPEN